MKKLIILFLFFSILFVFTGCAKYSPKTTNPAEVTFHFEGNERSALTFWRKLDANGKKGQIFSVGGNSKAKLMMNSGFKKPYSDTIMLDEGMYYLDSYQIVSGNGFIVSEGTHYTRRNGWDKEANAPLYLSFEVKSGQKLTLPKVNIIVKRESKDKFLTKLEYEDPNKIFIAGKKANEF
jgi:hypothetical protein